MQIEQNTIKAEAAQAAAALIAKLQRFKGVARAETLAAVQLNHGHACMKLASPAYGRQRTRLKAFETAYKNRRAKNGTRA